jgi:hypothetical protein
MMRLTISHPNMTVAIELAFSKLEITTARRSWNGDDWTSYPRSSHLTTRSVLEVSESTSTKNPKVRFCATLTVVKSSAGVVNLSAEKVEKIHENSRIPTFSA